MVCVTKFLERTISILSNTNAARSNVDLLDTYLYVIRFTVHRISYVSLDKCVLSSPSCLYRKKFIFNFTWKANILRWSHRMWWFREWRWRWPDRTMNYKHATFRLVKNANHYFGNSLKKVLLADIGPSLFQVENEILWYPCYDIKWEVCVSTFSTNMGSFNITNIK